MGADNKEHRGASLRIHTYLTTLLMTRSSDYDTCCVNHSLSPTPSPSLFLSKY